MLGSCAFDLEQDPADTDRYSNDVGQALCNKHYKLLFPGESNVDSG